MLHVFLEETKNLHRAFIDYDTLYFDSENKQNYYQLPEGKILVLLFGDIGNTSFTTIRRWTPEKEQYYRSHIGEMFKVEFL